MSMTTKALFFRCLICLACCLAIGCKGGLGGPTSGSYGKPVAFARGSVISFPDFTLEFLGERRVFAKPFGRDFVYFDFKITSGTTPQTVSWSAGTGDIGPTDFFVGGQQFSLALRQADGIGRLDEDEVVILR